MVYSKCHSGVWVFFSGLCGMEIAFLLLLTVALTAASPLRPADRTDTDAVLSQTSEVTEASADTQEQHAQSPGVIPFHSEDKHLDLDTLRHSDRMAVKLRPRRAPQRGCKFGTCQVHNLANDLYNIGKTNGKEESKKAKDPRGYGR